MRNVALLIIDNQLQQMIRAPSGAVDDVKGHVNRTWYTTSGLDWQPANQLQVSEYLCVCEIKIQAGRKSLP
jgi:hypothetical protein